MRKKLHTYFYRLTFFCLLLSINGVNVVSAQVSLTDEATHEIRFSKGQSQTQNQSEIISLSDLQQIISLDSDFQISEWSVFNSGQSEAENFYKDDGLQFISPGRIQLNSVDEPTFFAVSFKNESGQHFGSSVVVFDFIYHKENIQNDYQLTLQYRVNEGSWRRADGGIIRTSALSTTETDEWDTFSSQLHLDDIYLRENDELHLMWVFEGATDIEQQLSLALQGIEITPAVSRVPTLNRGDLIITEILPSTTVDGTDFEYVEIYNPSEVAVSLKGLELRSGSTSNVIEQNIEIPPFSLFVLSNVDISGINGVRHSHSYRDEITSSTGGRIELVQYNEVVAGATYEVQEPGTALQLDRAVNAYDGYTSLQYLRASEESFYPELSGSPGRFGNTVPVYKKTIEKEGWHLISPPGTFVTRLNRSSSLRFYTLELEPVSVDLIEPYTPVFIHKENSDPVTLYIEAASGERESLSIESRRAGRHVNLGIFRNPEMTNLNRVVRENDERLAPVYNIWNENRQKFELGFSADVILNNWTPFIYNNNVDERLGVDTAGTSSSGAVLDRFIPFRLYDGSGSNKSLIDEAVIGFMNHPVQTESIRYDLPKVVAGFGDDARLQKQSLIYLTSGLTDSPANSFIHFPYEPEDTQRAGIGYQFAASPGNASIEWDLGNDIPGEWVITLEDTQTGNSVDMRDVNSYRFRFSSEGNDESGTDERKGLTVFQPEEHNRFIVTVDPYEVIEEEEKEERPGSIELRQNYPNPFNPSTNITFFLPEDRSVKVGIYNIVGQQVAMLADETLSAGEHSIVWDASNNPSGIYIVQLETGNRILTRKITLIK
jgi:hypothetical protein